jgi:hypothetical protein
MPCRRRVPALWLVGLVAVVAACGREPADRELLAPRSAAEATHPQQRHSSSSSTSPVTQPGLSDPVGAAPVANAAIRRLDLSELPAFDVGRVASAEFVVGDLSIASDGFGRFCVRDEFGNMCTEPSHTEFPILISLGTSTTSVDSVTASRLTVAGDRYVEMMVVEGSIVLCTTKLAPLMGSGISVGSCRLEGDVGEDEVALQLVDRQGATIEVSERVPVRTG